MRISKLFGNILKAMPVVLSLVALFLSYSALQSAVWAAQPSIEARVIWTYSPGLNDYRDAVHPHLDIGKVRIISCGDLDKALSETTMVNINGDKITKDTDLRFAWLAFENIGGNAKILEIKNIEYSWWHEGKISKRVYKAPYIGEGRLLPKGEMLIVYLGQFRPGGMNEVAYLRHALQGNADLKYESLLSTWLKYILLVKPVEAQFVFWPTPPSGPPGGGD